jgi:hypothetical protein
MAQEWGLPSLIVALCAIVLTVSPISIQILLKITRPLLILLWPQSGRCESFEWAQISDGPLHTCSDPPRVCAHVGSDETERTFENVFAAFFALKCGTFVRKPKQLRLDTKYIRTDAKTLKVFLSLVNTRDVLSAFNVGEAPLEIAFQKVEGLTTAYLTVQRDFPPNLPRHYRLDASKHEMDLMLLGYPPWYQNPLVVGGGRHVPHPILDESDLHRGGWIVAVGFSPTRPINRHFWTKEERSEIVLRATDRIVTCFENLERAFPDEAIVPLAARVVQQVHKSQGKGFGYSGSHLRTIFDAGGFECRRSGRIFSNELSDEQIVSTMNVFSYNRALTPDEISLLGSKLETCIRACLLGVSEVFFHLFVVGERHDRPVPIPPELEGGGFIYVREKWKSLED